MSAPEPTSDPFGLVGSTIDGRYRVDAPIGEGGFGVVYRAWHIAFDHQVAVKCLKVPAHFTADARRTFLERFRAEGKVLSKLSEHPGIVRVFDFGVTNARGVEVPYLVLEWLEGSTLEDWLEARSRAGQPPVPATDAVRFFLPVIDAIAFAHSERIVHRDIKPANVFVVSSRRGTVLKVLDFGIAKAMQDGEHMTSAASGTSSGFHAFSPAYGAPEQFLAKRFGETGPWTDVHALALVLIEMMAGRRAFPGDDYSDLFHASISEGRPTPRALGVDVSEALDAVLFRALAAHVQQRYPHAAALRDALAGAIGLGAAQPPPAQPTSARTTPGEPAQGFASHATVAAVPASYGMVPQATPPDRQRPSHDGFAPQQLGLAPATPTHTPSSGSALGGTSPMGFEGVAVRPNPAQTTPGGPPEPFVAMATAVPQHGPPPGAWGPGAAAMPAAPAQARRKRGSGPIVGVAVGGLLLVGGGIGLFALTRTDDKKRDRKDESVDGGGTTKVEHFRSVIVLAKQPVGADPLADVAGKWHWRVTSKDGKVDQVDRVSPSGRVHETVVLVRGADGGVTRKRINGYGVQTETETWAADGSLSRVARSGVVSWDGCPKRSAKFDDSGRATELRCLDKTGGAVVDEDGCQVLKFTYDALGRVATRKCTFADGKPATSISNGHELRNDIGPDGLLRKATFWSQDGTQMVNNETCYGYGYKNDAAGNTTETVCLDVAGNPFDTGNGISGNRLTFDSNGCELRREFIDVKGNMFAVGGVARTVYKRDLLCNELYQENQNAKGEISARPRTPAVTSYKLDAKGQTIEERCADSRNKPVDCTFAQALEGSLVKVSYDDKGRVVSRKGFTAEGGPSGMAQAYPHEMRFEYGADGLQSVKSYFDVQGKPSLALGDVARLTFVYDAMGGTLSEKSFGKNNEPATGVIKCHEIRRAYDELHRLSAVECRGTDGQFAESDLCQGNVCWPVRSVRVVIERSVGSQVANVFYGRDGKEMKRVDCGKLPCYK